MKWMAVAAALWACWMVPVAGRADSPVTIPADDDLARSIQRLSEAKYAAREAAEKHLEALGWRAMTPLLIAQGERGPEAKSRCARVIQYICLHGTALPAETVQRLEKYDALSPGDRPRTDLQVDSDPDARFVIAEAAFLRHATWDSGVHVDAEGYIFRHATQLRARGAWNELEWALIASSQESDFDTPEIARIAIVHGDVEQSVRAILALKKLVPADERTDSLDKLLLQLARSLPDREEALTLAKSIKDYGDGCAVHVLAARQDWKALADYPLDGNENLTHFVALQFDGKPDMAEAIIRRNWVMNPTKTSVAVAHLPMLMGRPEISQQMLVLQKEYMRALQLLFLQRRYSDAIALVEKAKSEYSDLADDLETQEIPEFVRLNERERALQMIREFDTRDSQRPESPLHEAFQRAHYLLRDGQSPLEPFNDADGADPWHFKMAMYTWGDEAYGWKAALETWNPEILYRDRDEMVRQIFEDKLPAEKLCAILDKSASVGDPAGSPGNIYGVCRLVRLHATEAAARYIPCALSPCWQDEFQERLEMPMGVTGDDVYTRVLLLRDWQTSEKMLKLLAEKGERKAVFGYLHAVALRKASGSVLLPTSLEKEDDELGGDLAGRAFVANLLFRLGELQLARSQAEEILPLSSLGEDVETRAHEILSMIDLKEGHYADALKHLRLSMFGHLSLRDNEDFCLCTRVPRTMDFLEAMVAISAGEPARAFAAGKLIPALDPEDLGYTVELVKAFREKHWEQEAVELASVHRQALEQILAAFPNSYLHHYLIAQLDEETAFVSDKSLGHVEAALRLAPGNAEYEELENRIKAKVGTRPQ